MNNFILTEVQSRKFDLPETIYIPEYSFVHGNHLGKNSCTSDWSHTPDRAYRFHCWGKAHPSSLLAPQSSSYHHIWVHSHRNSLLFGLSMYHARMVCSVHTHQSQFHTAALQNHPHIHIHSSLSHPCRTHGHMDLGHIHSHWSHSSHQWFLVHKHTCTWNRCIKIRYMKICWYSRVKQTTVWIWVHNFFLYLLENWLHIIFTHIHFFFWILNLI